MAETYIDLPLKEAALISSQYPDDNFGNLPTYDIGSSKYHRWLLLRFDAPPASISTRRLYRAQVIGKYTISHYNFIYAASLFGDWSSLFVTWNTRPAKDNKGYDQIDAASTPASFATPDWDGPSSTSVEYTSKYSYELLTGSGVAILLNESSSVYYGACPVPTEDLKLRVYYDDSTNASAAVRLTNAPRSGYVDPRVDQTFEWDIVKSSGSSYYPVSPFTQTDATLFWKETGESSWNLINAGTNMAVTVPANTFPVVSEVTWYLSVTDNAGRTATSPQYTVSTADSLQYATAISPADSIEANDGPITFRWTASNASGTTPGQSRIEYSSNGGSTWADLAVVGSGFAYTAPANTFPSGTILWRVQTQNIDGVYGPVSDPVQFISYGAPAAPSVSVSGQGFATVNWQATEQEAYRVTVDGTVYGPFFGAAKRFELPDVLTPGEHTVSVEVQNTFGLWSLAGTVTKTVRSSTGRAPVLTVTSDGPDALISWSQTASAATNAIYLYRDGVRIAKLAGTFPTNFSGIFSDRFVLGTHTWQLVRNYNDYAILSNSVTLTLRSCVTRIASFSGGPWIELKLSEDEQRVEAFSGSRSVSLRHVTGSEYPVAEIGPYLDGSGSYDAAFQTVQELAAFEALFGQPVIVKSRGGQVMVGVLSNLSKRMGEFYIAVSFTLSRIHWRDYLDVSDS